MSIDVLNLASLPPEIIFIIARQEEDSLDEMRLISRSWNTSVLGHLTDNRFKPVLERVYFDSAMECDFAPGDDNAPEVDDLLKMWAIVPERRAGARIGLGKWLSVHRRLPGALEVSCAPHRMVVSNKPQDNFVEEVQSNRLDTITLGASACAVASLLAGHRYSTLIGCAFLVAPVAYSLYRSLVADQSKPPCNGDIEEVRTSITRLTRFFDAFGRIDLVALELDPTRDVIEEALKTIGNRRIKRLHIDGYNCSDNNQRAIVDLVRNHRIEHVSILTCHCRKLHFCKFVREIVQMHATLDIYERGKQQSPDKYFERPRSYWDEKARILEQEGITMAISCEDDDDFDERLDENYMRFHLKMRGCELRMSDVSEYSIFKVASRGYSRQYN